MVLQYLVQLVSVCGCIYNTFIDVTSVLHVPDQHNSKNDSILTFQ
jgi:hypothetical protein